MSADSTAPDSIFNYAYAAQEEARKAGVAANYANRYKQEYYEQESILQKWSELMVNAPVLLQNTMFIIFATVNIALMWTLMYDVVYHSGIPNALVPWALLLFCLLLAVWSAVTAHMFGRGLSHGLQDWETWNFIFIKNRNQLPPGQAQTTVRREIWRARITAMVSAGVLLALLTLLIYYRFKVMPYLPEDDESPSALSVAHANHWRLSMVMGFLPLALVVGQFFTGNFIYYAIRRMQVANRLKKSQKLFLKYKEICGMHDQLAVRYTEVARQRGENVQLGGDLENSHLRLRNRSQQSDNYIDPLEHVRHVTFTFKYQTSGKPVVNAPVFGILPNGAKTGDYYTDDQGRVTLQSDNEIDQVVAVQIKNKNYVGPFLFKGEHFIDLPEFLLEDRN